MYIHIAAILALSILHVVAETCVLQPLGPGLDDTDQIEAAVQLCGNHGTLRFEQNLVSSFNITRKMLWDLDHAKVDLYADLSFQPDIEYWLNETNTYRVVFIQSQAPWFVVTGSNFEIDAHNVGGIQGNGQPWWEYFTNHTRADGDGRPISLTVWNATNGTISNFKISSPPFWCNAVAQSQDIIYNGMTCNATNINPTFFGTNIVPNTDGINTYRSDGVQLLHWDVTCGDDCLAIKGNSSNIIAQNITCRGGNGIAFGSLGQYANLSDIVENVHIEDVVITRINTSIQPNMNNGIYFKSWDGSVNGAPPTGGGAGPGHVSNIVTKNIHLDRVNLPIHLYQTNGGHSADLQSRLQFSNLSFIDWTGTALTNTIIDFECSGAAGGCPNISFANFSISPPSSQAPRYICQNVTQLSGLEAPCNGTGLL